MLRRPPRSTRTDTLVPYTTLFRSALEPLRGTGHRRGWRCRAARRHRQGDAGGDAAAMLQEGWNALLERHHRVSGEQWARCHQPSGRADARRERTQEPGTRSEEHTSELQSLMRISYAVFCLKKKNKREREQTYNINKRNTQLYMRRHMCHIT